MTNSNRNLILIIAAIAIGLVLGLIYPTLGLVLLLPVVGFIVFIFMRNRGGSDADESVAAEARQFTTAPDKAAIYIMRKGFVAGQQGLNVTIDDSLNTQFRTGRFVKAELEPGEHSVLTQMASQTKGTAKTETVILAAGECVLLDAQIKMGALQGSVELLEIRDAAQARQKLAGLKLVDWKTPGE